MLIKLNKILRIAILMGFIVLLVFLLKYPTHHCDLCEFEWEGEKINANDFTKIYFGECFSEPDMNILNITLNQSPSASINNSLNSKSLN